MKQLVLSLFLTASLSGQNANEQEALVGALFEAREPAAFEEALAAAKAAKISNQILVEAQFLNLVDNADRATLAAFAPVLKAQLDRNEMDDSVIFAVKEDFMAVHEYTLALAALEKNDAAAFKKHITEAFWLSPSQAGVFGPHVNEHRLAQKMATITIDLEQEFEIQKKKSGKTTLKQLLGNSPAIALHFWTPWAQESVNSMPDFLATAKVLHKNNIAVASLLITGNEDSRTDGDTFLTEIKSPNEATWLVDPKDKRLSTTLRIANFPTIVVVSKDGSILFHGHPGSDEFWKKLKKLSPEIERPQSPLIDLPSSDDSEATTDNEKE